MSGEHDPRPVPIFETTNAEHERPLVQLEAACGQQHSRWREGRGNSG